MGQLRVNMHITLDGVIQANGHLVARLEVDQPCAYGVRRFWR
jgi:hypothetical protein